MLSYALFRLQYSLTCHFLQCGIEESFEIGENRDTNKSSCERNEPRLQKIEKNEDAFERF